MDYRQAEKGTSRTLHDKGIAVMIYDVIHGRHPATWRQLHTAYCMQIGNWQLQLSSYWIWILAGYLGILAALIPKTKTLKLAKTKSKTPKNTEISI